MARATKTQKSQHLNAAYALLSRGAPMTEGATTLSRERGISLRQAYRYLEQARTIGHAVPIVDVSVPVTFKIPRGVVDQLRAYSTTSRLTLSEIVTRALETFLTAVRRRGRHG
jgi:hypothetical protein